MLRTIYRMLRVVARHLLLALRSLMSTLRILYHSKYEKIPQENGEKRLIVCGNGPSLGKQLQESEDVFRSNDVLCVNQFSATEWFFTIRPRYYCIMDPVSISDPTTLTADARQRIDAAWDGLERADWEMELILPRYFQKSKYLQERVKRLSIPVRYLNLTEFSGWRWLHDYFLSKQLCSPGVQTVLIAAVYYGICKGYKEIVLLGAETNWVKELEVDEENQVYFNDSHYYGEKNKRKLIDAWGRSISVAEELECDARVFRQYMFLDAYAKRQKCVIYNATPNSLVDAFARIFLDRLC